MEYLFIYGLQICGFLNNFLWYLGFLSIIGFIFGIMLYCMANDWYGDNTAILNLFKFVKNLTIICASLLVFISFIPTKQTLLLMGGTYLGKKAVNEVVQSDKMEKINTIIDLQLDKYIKDLQGATK